jgi:hypothetical protein
MPEVDFNLEVPLNNISFGQTSIQIIRELFRREIYPPIIPITANNNRQIDISAQNPDENFNIKLNECLKKQGEYKPKTFKLWHINGSVNSLGREQTLLTFHETDELTKDEYNIIHKSKRVIVTSKDTQALMTCAGFVPDFIPLAFDSWNFKKIEKKYFDDERIVFLLPGKLEHRKRTAKTIKAWLKKFGNNTKYFLQVACHNVFLPPEEIKNTYQDILGGKIYSNITFFDWMPTNAVFNDYLNSGHIVLAMSGGEAFGLPEFHATALGKYCVGHYATGYKSWMNEKNSILVRSSGKFPSNDGKFFNKGDRFNQGSFYDWNEDMFIAACEEAVRKVKDNPINETGLELQQNFTIEKTVDKILESLS